MTQADLFAIEPAEAIAESQIKLLRADPLLMKAFGGRIHRARHSDPASSHLAAAAIEETAESQCIRILAEVVKHPGCTTQELAAISGWSVHTLGRRLPELRTKGKVFNPWFGAGVDAMQLRRCAIRNRLALCWCPSVLP